ncbi:MAG: hypothetical protein ABIN25_02175, partial [Ginsengibacter sp.]
VAEIKRQARKQLTNFFFIIVGLTDNVLGVKKKNDGLYFRRLFTYRNADMLSGIDGLNNQFKATEKKPATL